MIGSRSKNIVIWTFVAIALILLSAPTVVVLGASFTAGNIITFPPQGLSLKWYGAILGASDLRQAFVRSLIVSAICTRCSSVKYAVSPVEPRANRPSTPPAMR